jgi:hypothetical protein
LNGIMLDCCFMDGTTNGTMAPTSFNTVVLTPVSYPTSAPTATSMAPSMMVGMPTFTPSISALPTIIPPPTASGVITSALCSDNQQCAAFDLQGECCPDLNGTILDCCSAGSGIDQAASDMPSDVPSDMPSADLLIATTTAPSLSPIANSTTMEPTTTPTEPSEPTKSPVATPSPGTPVSKQVQGMSMILSGVGNLDDAAITSWTAMTIDFYESVHANDNRRGRNRQTRRRNRQLETEGIEDFSTAITFQSQNVADNRNTIMYSQQVDYVQTSDDAPSAMQLIEQPFQDESLTQVYTDTLRSSNEAFETLPASGNDAVQLVTPDSTPPTTDPPPTSGAASAAALSRIVVMMGITTVACLFISTSLSLFS